MFSGRKSASQVAAANEVSISHIYKWKVQLDEKAKGAKLDEVESSGLSMKEINKQMLAVEAERDTYQKMVGEQALIIELLKTPEIDELTTAERIDWVDRNFRSCGPKKKARAIMNLAESTYYADPKISR